MDREPRTHRERAAQASRIALYFMKLNGVGGSISARHFWGCEWCRVIADDGDPCDEGRRIYAAARLAAVAWDHWNLRWAVLEAFA